jgi:hypothetical protein
MKSQMLKGMTMVMLVVSVAFVAAVVSANGQTGRVSSHVPFDFVVGGETLPAGDYEIRSATSGSQALTVQNSESRTAVIRLTNVIEPKNNTQSRLIFHRYGQKYFLAEVWSGGDTSGRQLLESKQERAIRRETSALAKNAYETIELVATLR